MGAIIISTLLMVFFALSFIRTVQEPYRNNAARSQRAGKGSEAGQGNPFYTGAGNRCIQIKRYGNSL